VVQLRSAFQTNDEVTMSADKDRAIRRQKQKRAKDLKKQARQPQPQQQADSPRKSTKSPVQHKGE